MKYPLIILLLFINIKCSIRPYKDEDFINQHNLFDKMMQVKLIQLMIKR